MEMRAFWCQVLNEKNCQKVYLLTVHQTHTMYSEVLDLIASYECGLAAMIKDQSEQLRRKLNNWELSDLFTAFETLPLWKTLIVRARTKMASRDMALRDAFHYQLKEYIKPLDAEEYEKFLGAAGDELEKLMQENADSPINL